MSDPIFSVAAYLTKHEVHATGCSTKGQLCNGFRSAKTEDEAMGAYVKALTEDYPEHAISAVLILKIE